MTGKRKTAFDAEKAKEGRAILKWLVKTGSIIAAILAIDYLLGFGGAWIFEIAVLVVVSRLVLAILASGSNSPRR